MIVDRREMKATIGRFLSFGGSRANPAEPAPVAAATRPHEAAR
jgi:hypothetical protein